MKKIELNVPAGNYEKFLFAVEYGADAVYLSGKKFGLRAFADNFSEDEIEQAVKIAHNKGIKIYVTLNIFAHNSDFSGLEDYIQFLNNVGIDAVIISDPGIFRIVKKTVPSMKIFISTQSNNLNYNTANFWYEQGATRIILARELSLEEINDIKNNTNIEIEIFGHGAVCISYSGRCYLSKYLTGRDANKGECTHPCRWNYYITEPKRPGQYFPVFEDGKDTYIFNSRDLNSIGLLDKIYNTGIDSIKIEGRMKGLYYVAVTTSVYRQALNLLYKEKKLYKEKIDFFQNELLKVSHRHYHTGFLKGNMPDKEDYNTGESRYYRSYDFIGIVKNQLNKNMYEIEIRSQLKKNDNIEILSPELENKTFNLKKMFLNDKEIEVANPNQIIRIECNIKLGINNILRKKIDNF